MILQIESTQIEQPKISLNQLGEFPFASDKKKVEILRNQKFVSKICAPYYRQAYDGILRSFKDGAFREDLLAAEADKINASEAEETYQLKKRENNVTALECLIEIGPNANPSLGKHRIVRQNARINMDGVIVSARPEIITENPETRDCAFTKLRLSKSKTSADAQEIVLLVLLHYGQQQSHDGLIFSIEKTKLIDCFSKTVVLGHTIGRHRDQQLHRSLEEIRLLWPTIQKKNSGGE